MDENQLIKKNVQINRDLPVARALIRSRSFDSKIVSIRSSNKFAKR